MVERENEPGVTTARKGTPSFLRVGGASQVAAWIRQLPLGPSLILLVVLILAIFGDLIMPHNPVKNELRQTFLPPFWYAGGGTDHLLGTDHLGRDVLSRLIGGARISLIVGFTAVVVAGAIGTTLAIIAGYWGGWVDAVIMRLTDSMLSMPFLLVAVAVAGILGPGLKNLIIILGAMSWAIYARVLRSEVLRLREADFVKLAVVAGCSRPHIALRHIFPNIVNSLIVLASLQLGITIIAEAALSFLGLGVPPPAPSWGSMLADGRLYITTSWWLSFFPGLAITFTVLGTNLLGDWLRVRLDPKFRQL